MIYTTPRSCRAGLLAFLVILLTAATAPAGAGSPQVRTFAMVPDPGFPNSALVLPDETVLVSTNRGPDAGPATGLSPTATREPSRLYRYSSEGALLDSYVVEGQNLDDDHGLMGMTLDKRGRIYVVDYSPPRVVRVDLRSRQQETYASIPDLRPCLPGDTADCENGVGDAKPWPVVPFFLEDGRMLVSDLAQGTIFVVAPGGGDARLWSQHPDWMSTFGPSGLRLDQAGDLWVSVTGSRGPHEESVGGTPTAGAIYRVPMERNAAGTPERIYETLPGEAPDQFTVGASGRLYIATLTTDTIIVVEPDGDEIERITHTEADVPFDSPSSATFLGSRLLVTNLTFFTSDPSHWAVLEVTTEDRGLPMPRPRIPG